MKDVFISFQSADDALAVEAQAFLELQGWTSWRCTRAADNPAGDVWMRTLVEALVGTKVMLLLYSHTTAQSRHVFRELSMADEAGKKVLVVCLDDAPFPDEWLFLVRTMQMLNARRQPPAEWLPTVAAALRRHLDARCALPIDSIADRWLKVRFCREMQRALFGEVPVRVLGAVVHLPGIVRACLDAPQRVTQQLRALDRALAALTAMPEKPPGPCTLPFRGAEDVLFLVCLAGTAVEEEQAAGFLQRLPQTLAEATGNPSAPLALEVRLLPAQSWELADDEESRAAFFADPGVEWTGDRKRARAARNPPPPLSERAQRLLAQVAAASVRTDGADAGAVRLPKAMTITEADERLRCIFAGR